MDHITEFLGPYIDGELRPSQVKRIENHLKTCECCRSELNELRQLSALLQEDASLPSVKSEDQFVAEVGLLMDRQPETPAFKRVLVTGWKAIPVSLAGTWIFIQTSLVVTGLFTIISRIAPDLPGIAQLSPALPASVWSSFMGSISQPAILQVLEGITHFLQMDMPVTRRVPILTLLPFFIGILYVCWLASWWIVREYRITQETI